jgi:hypothetical protein
MIAIIAKSGLENNFKSFNIAVSAICDDMARVIVKPQPKQELALSSPADIVLLGGVCRR